MTIEADFDVLPNGRAVPLPRNGRGGARPGAGRPKRSRMAEVQAEVDLFGDEAGEEATTAVRFNLAKTRKEEALAGIHELNLKIQSGAYLPRDAYREASATALATLSQSLRSLPDLLERKHALTPEALQMVEQLVDQVLNDAANQLALFTEAGV